jgi:hypothetical protein
MDNRDGAGGEPVQETVSADAVTLAVVRQDQAGAFAVVTGSGQELSLLPGPYLIERQIYPRGGDLVAVQHGQIVYHWYRALVLRTAPEGVRVRLSTGEQLILPVNPHTIPPDPPLRPTEAVFASRTEIVARAWTWFEPEPPSPALDAYAVVAVQQAEP